MDSLAHVFAFEFGVGVLFRVTAK